MQRLSFYKHLSLYSHKNKLDMKPLILSFFAVLLGYSFFFDKDDEIKLRNVDQISLESNSTMPERGDSVPNTPEYILRIAKPEDYLFTK